MRLLLHIGLEKTGTTSIQDSFRAAEADLLKSGILYPAVRDNWAWMPHHFLVGLLAKPDAMPRWLLHQHDNDPKVMARWCEQVWADVRKQCRQHAPELVVLSSEALTGRISEGDIARLAARLREQFSEVRICVYVRNPADRYMAIVQQFSRFSSKLPAPTRQFFREKIEARKKIETYEKCFGVKVEVVPFRRDLLIDGDVVRDFCSRFLVPMLPEASWPKTHRVNESISPEAMAIRQSIRRGALADVDERVEGTDSQLQVLIDSVEKTMGPPRRPVLHAPIRGAILRGSTELLWLRDKYGIIFPDIEYDRIDGIWTREFEGISRVQEVCSVDEERREAILAKVVLGLLKKVDPER